MKRVFGLAITTLVLVYTAWMPLVAQGPPAWAYGTSPVAAPAGAPAAAPAPGGAAPQAAPDTSLKRVPGSSLEFTRAQISDGFGPADWYPGDHPQMPDIVAHGRKPDARACSLCHYPNGKGRPENAGVAGLPLAYFIQQMNDFKNGNRKSAEPRKANTNAMIAIAKALTDDEIKATAEYFGSMKWTPWIKVMEIGTVPKTRIAGGMFVALEGSESEPLGQRIIEVPEKTEATEVLRDPRSGFIAYAPVGSIKKGELLVTTGGGKTTQCGVCHGADLKGLGPVPGIAGRSPSYLVRQMYDMQQGARKGTWTELMKPVVSKLSEEDMLNIAAYTSSRIP
jgi:cytochrome c553